MVRLVASLFQIVLVALARWLMSTKPIVSDLPDDLLTTAELAVKLHISISTVRAWAERGHIPQVPLGPKTYRYSLAAVLAALAKWSDRAAS